MVWFKSSLVFIAVVLFNSFTQGTDLTLSEWTSVLCSAFNIAAVLSMYFSINARGDVVANVNRTSKVAIYVFILTLIASLVVGSIAGAVMSVIWIIATRYMVSGVNKELAL